MSLVLLFAGGAAPPAPGEGTATGTWTFTGSAVGARTPKGTGAGTWTFTGTATGQRAPKATGTGTWTFTGSAVGSAPGSTPRSEWGLRHGRFHHPAGSAPDAAQAPRRKGVRMSALSTADGLFSKYAERRHV